MPLSLTVNTLPILLKPGKIIRMIFPVENITENVNRIKAVVNVYYMSKGITQFYLSPTHKPYLPVLPSSRSSPPFGWYSG